MDIEQEQFQVLSFFGIYHEAYKIMLSNRYIFTQISITLILPLALFCLFSEYISNIIVYVLFNILVGKDSFRGSSMGEQIVYGIISTFTIIVLVRFLYLMLILLFSIFPITAVTYTVSSAYASQTITLKKVMSLLPQKNILRKLLITFGWYFIAMLSYNTIACIFLIAFTFATLSPQLSITLSVILITLVIMYIIGFAYLTIIWHMASIVSILEEGYGLDAIKTSRLLIKGKMKVAMMITIKNSLIFVAIEFGLGIMVTDGGFESGLLKMLVALPMLAVLIMLIVFGLVSFNVLYFVCKAHHHEMVDKSRLFDHLECYFGEFEPLKGRDVQLEQYSV